MPWYSVRCILKTAGSHYEERITLWDCPSFEDAVEQAEREARQYADDIGDTHYLGLAQAYWLPNPPSHGAEVFSLIRDSDLEPPTYIDRFFDTGTEHQREWEGRAPRTHK